MTQTFDLLVFIGRFQPVHIGHLEVIQTALQRSQHVVILVGSSNQPRTSKNPWTFAQRADMIMESLAAIDPSYCSRVIIKPLRDQKYNDQKWATGVQEHIEDAQVMIRMGGYDPRTPTLRVGIIGHSKDESSYYLKMFPQWELVEHAMNEDVSATDLRRLVFEDKSMKFLAGVLSAHVYDELQAFKKTPEFVLLKREYDMIKMYKKSWEVAPYPPTFVTTDAVVVQSGHILLIERGAAPGEGLWALPGGFLNQGEFIEDGALRELREETKLKVPMPVLRGSIKATKVFDRPDRDPRGRFVTHAYLIELPPGELPTVKGSDDARKARWIPIADVEEDQMYADHYHIVQYFLGRV
jgi:bifunctional NMN adenylyltransferase/nudix hydrolase